MSRSKILFQISGSIAAYKSAGIISKLVQSGYEVQTVATPSALKFIGWATLEGLTGKPVLSDMFESGKLMDHINLIKWADVVVLAPATANTINRLAQGLSDDLIGALFLAHDWEKPYLLAPAMNTKMYTHPATQASLETLRKWGVNILPTADGYLACGDEGAGKMLEPKSILKAIFQALPKPANVTKVLITSGATRETIDNVRFVSNISTGRTGSDLAEAMIRQGYSVTFLHGFMSKTPDLVCKTIPYSSSQDLATTLNEQLSAERYDAVIHLAAVSDFLPDQVDNGKALQALPFTGKLSSDLETLTMRFRRNSKLVETIRSQSLNPHVQVIAFKLTSGSDVKQQLESVKALFSRNVCDLVVANDMDDRLNDQQTSFKLFESNDPAHPTNAGTSSDLAGLLMDKIALQKEINL